MGRCSARVDKRDEGRAAGTDRPVSVRVRAAPEEREGGDVCFDEHPWRDAVGPDRGEVAEGVGVRGTDGHVLAARRRRIGSWARRTERRAVVARRHDQQDVVRGEPGSKWTHEFGCGPKLAEVGVLVVRRARHAVGRGCGRVVVGTRPAEVAPEEQLEEGDPVGVGGEGESGRQIDDSKVRERVRRAVLLVEDEIQHRQERSESDGVRRIAGFVGEVRHEVQVGHRITAHRALRVRRRRRAAIERSADHAGGCGAVRRAGSPGGVQTRAVVGASVVHGAQPMQRRSLDVGMARVEPPVEHDRCAGRNVDRRDLTDRVEPVPRLGKACRFEAVVRPVAANRFVVHDEGVPLVRRFADRGAGIGVRWAWQRCRGIERHVVRGGAHRRLGAQHVEGRLHVVERGGSGVGDLGDEETCVAVAADDGEIGRLERRVGLGHRRTVGEGHENAVARHLEAEIRMHDHRSVECGEIGDRRVRIREFVTLQFEATDGDRGGVRGRRRIVGGAPRPGTRERERVATGRCDRSRLEGAVAGRADRPREPGLVHDHDGLSGHDGDAVGDEAGWSQRHVEWVRNRTRGGRSLSMDGGARHHRQRAEDQYRCNGRSQRSPRRTVVVKITARVRTFGKSAHGSNLESPTTRVMSTTYSRPRLLTSSVKDVRREVLFPT